MQWWHFFTQTAVATVILALLSFNGSEAAAGDEEENSQEFAALCRLTKLIQKGLDEAPLPSVDADNKLENDADKLQTLAGSNLTDINQKKEAGKYGLKEDDRPLPQTPQGVAAAKAVNITTEQLKQTKKATNDLKIALSDAVKQANTELRKALYGDETINGGFQDGNSIFKSTNKDKVFGNSHSHNKNCGGENINSATTGSNAGITIANDIFCLCIHGEHGSKKLCTDQGTTITASTDIGSTTATSIATEWDKLMSACPDPQEHPTSSEIRTAINAVLSLIGGNTNNPSTGNAQGRRYVLGYIDNTATGCTGAAKQTCVSYHVHLKHTKKTEIPWVKTATDALSKLDKVQAPIPNEIMLPQLTALNASAWQEYALGFVTNQTPGAHAAAKSTDTDTAQQTDIAEKSCNEAKTHAACKNKTGCTYDATNKKCTLSEEGKQPAENTAAGNQAGTDGKNTAGSNSFVINKAPLLLAVSLF
uniref:Variant surface glycoprotein n=1 Tax=Trypanosoma brucei TaxID=5691 RepID=S5FXP1_9TRYP|nr:variant surface glycoprotein [Trypanosoma brucei]